MEGDGSVIYWYRSTFLEEFLPHTKDQPRRLRSHRRRKSPAARLQNAVHGSALLYSCPHARDGEYDLTCVVLSFARLQIARNIKGLRRERQQRASRHEHTATHSPTKMNDRTNGISQRLGERRPAAQKASRYPPARCWLKEVRRRCARAL
jgi:hypothetical protein